MNRCLMACTAGVLIGTAGCGGSPTPSELQNNSGMPGRIAALPEPGFGADVEPSETINPEMLQKQIAALHQYQAKQAEEVFAKLVKAAEDGDPGGWEAANQELQRLAAEAVPALIPELRSSEPLRREMAVTFLAQLGPDAAPAADDLAALLDDASPIIRVNAAAALSALEAPFPASIETLTELVNHEELPVRETAIAALGNAGRSPETVLPVLAKCLADPEIRVRISAAIALGQYGQAAQSFVPKLQLLAGDEDENVRNAVTTALQLIEGAPDDSAANRR